MPESVDDLLDALRAAGGRVTAPRRAVVGALVDAKGHVTAEELTALVRDKHPDVAESTVYRILDELERLELVVHVHLGHGPASYHLAQTPHAHLVCTTCNRVVEIPIARFARLTRQLETDHGFVPDYAHFAIVGRCEACREPARRPRRQPR
ncbi:MAG: transcriptional repressor [Actinobacteria bacterium]|nr:transcriptional repressor [Actinomycetota bacterium]MBV9666356.1 transcriptional repressor [Actinomycetota bacterium]MBV9935528.1 transcriptional repressor [Actinomycetota bacterium]